VVNADLPVTPLPFRRVLVDAALGRTLIAIRFERKQLECVAVGKVASVDVSMVRIQNGRNDEGYMIPLTSITEIAHLETATQKQLPAAAATAPEGG
jgi:hypothetical protein